MTRSRTYISAMVLAFCTIWCGRAQSYMYVQMISDDIVYFRTAEHPTITYTEAELTVSTTTGLSQSYPIDRVKSIWYSSKQLSNNMPKELTGTIKVFTMTGILVTTLESIENIGMLKIPHGIYILSGSDSAQKICIK